MMVRVPRSLLLFLLLVGSGVHAQWDTLYLPFRALTIEEGLSQGMVNAIIQDRAGFMWFATKDGLNRYDGYSFTVFRHDPEDTTTVRDNTIEALYEDRAGLIWVGTNSGLDVFDPATEVFQHFPCVDRSSGPPAGKARSLMPIGSAQCATKAITQDAAGHLWVSMGQGLYRIGPDRNGSSGVGPGAEVDLVGVFPGVKLSWMSVDRSGLLRGTWTLTRTELDVSAFTLDTRDEARIKAMIADPQLLPSSPIAAGQGAEDLAAFAADTDRPLNFCLGIALLGARVPANKTTTTLQPVGWMNVVRPTTDAHGALWASDHRLFRYDPRTRRTTRLLPASSDLRLEPLLVVCLFRDRTGVLWMGTNGYGVLLYDPRGNPSTRNHYRACG
ncbi:MAG: hypothetical protein IPJ85_10190 [Flavobacteriales bacterium]|nr:hypothetical protein [Flavobacteriales bacterium]